MGSSTEMRKGGDRPGGFSAGWAMITVDLKGRPLERKKQHHGINCERKETRGRQEKESAGRRGTKDWKRKVNFMTRKSASGR